MPKPNADQPLTLALERLARRLEALPRGPVVTSIGIVTEEDIQALYANVIAMQKAIAMEQRQ